MQIIPVGVRVAIKKRNEIKLIFIRKAFRVIPVLCGSDAGSLSEKLTISYNAERKLCTVRL